VKNIYISKKDYEKIIELLEIAMEFFKKEGYVELIIECQKVLDRLRGNEEKC
jgi:hypothetical protein